MDINQVIISMHSFPRDNKRGKIERSHSLSYNLKKIYSDESHQKSLLSKKRLSRSASFSSPSESPKLPLEANNLKFLAPSQKMPTPKMEHRVFEIWPGKNQFSCGGKCITGPTSDLKYMVGTWLIIITISAIYFIIPAPSLAESFTICYPLISAFLLILSVIFLLITKYMDPGIIPRKEIFEIYGSIPEKFTAKVFEQYAGCGNKLSSEEKNSIIQAFEYCTTCKIFRPPRASHCA